MNKLPTSLENPTGLHTKYSIQKITYIEGSKHVFLRDPDPNAEYFVLRLDTGGSDPEHIKACRIGIHAYADAVEHHLPQLAKDLRERYPLLP